MKPEILSVDLAPDVLAHVESRLQGDGVAVGRVALHRAADYMRRSRLRRLYPRLHRIGDNGASALSRSASRQLESFLEANPAMNVYGVSQLVESGLSANELDKQCRKNGVQKLGTGSYVSLISLGGCHTAVLNGFLPAMRNSYKRDCLVAAIECRSQRTIQDLRSNVLGPLDPNMAGTHTLRGSLAALMRGCSQGSLSQSRNGIHLSAGYLEASYQVWREFMLPEGASLSQTQLAKQLASRGVPSRFVESLESDPNLQNLDESPFELTEGAGWEKTIELIAGWARECTESP